ncbi:hypothetical protein GQ53DRAFT_743856 [Thozetella sp. PMI_491]|nr:hypothetical protein GQ53DRAFT_743856 [Thozetella sp. PMI_491]
MANILGKYEVTPMQLARGATYVIGSFGLFMNARALADPVSYATAFGFHPSTVIAKSAISNPFIVVSGGRAIASGVALLGCAYLGADRATGVLLMSSVLTGILDAWAVTKFGGQVTDTQAEARGIQEERLEHAKSAATGHVVITSLFATMGAWMWFTAEN